MFRLTTISVAALLAVVCANGASIQIGGASGITTNYIAQGAGAVCAAGAGQCASGSTTGWTDQRNFDNILFAGATNTGGTVSPTPFTGYTQTGGTPTGQTITNGSGTTFSMVSDGVAVNNSSNNYWESNGTGGATDSITVPVGLFGVTDVWTMLDNQWGSLGGNDTTVTFNFGTSSNQTAGLTSVVVPLTDSANNGSTPGGEIRAAMACITVTTATCSNATNPHGVLQNGVTINGVTVNTGTVYNTFSYTSTSPSGFYAGTQGKLKLDDQQFVFGSAYLNDWLVSITVTENDANTFASNPAAPSETALTAITVDTVPEPTSVLLFLAGLGSLGGLMRLRRN